LEKDLKNYPHLWYTELYTTKNMGLMIRIKKMLYSAQSDIQRIDIFESYDLGRIFALDGITMTSEKDEFMYHEMLVHVPMFLHPNPRKVLVIGGGDGGSIREVMKHDCVEKAILCEIDPMVIEAARKYLPTTSCEFDNPKVEIINENGAEFVKNFKNEFDVIIIDSTDPFAGEGGALFTEEFYKSCYDALTENGVLSAESEGFYDHGWTEMAYGRIKKVFPITRLYLGFVPVYPSGLWGYTFGAKKIDPIKDFDEERVKNFKKKLRYYNHEVHKASFALPNFIKEMLEKIDH